MTIITILSIIKAIRGSIRIRQLRGYKVTSGSTAIRVATHGWHVGTPWPYKEDTTSVINQC